VELLVCSLVTKMLSCLCPMKVLNNKIERAESEVQNE
jgi:hypothetical protein